MGSKRVVQEVKSESNSIDESDNEKYTSFVSGTTDFKIFSVINEKLQIQQMKFWKLMISVL